MRLAPICIHQGESGVLVGLVGTFGYRFAINREVQNKDMDEKSYTSSQSSL